MTRYFGKLRKSLRRSHAWRTNLTLEDLRERFPDLRIP